MYPPAQIPATRDLPLDIWELVSQFLTDEQLKGMFSVNKAFFHIAMKLRYREITIREVFGSRSSGAQKCYLMAINFPESSRYVRSLIFEPVRLSLLISDFSTFNHNFGQPIPTEQFTVRLNQLKSLSEGKAQARQLEIVHRIREFIGALDHLTDLTVEYDAISPLEPNETSLTLLSSAWGVIGHRLQSLTLKGNIYCWKTLPFLSLHLRSLETLRIELAIFTMAETLTAQAILVPFIKRHSGTLGALTLKSCHSTNLDAIYGEIGHLPRLRRLEIHESLQDETPYNPALHHFLSQHVDSLVDFAWGIRRASWPGVYRPRPECAHNLKPPSVTLPNLTKLNLSLWGSPQPDRQGSLMSYVGRHETTLTSLSLSGWLLTSGQFHSLVNGLPMPGLRQLDISVENLTPSTFQFLATKFPGLSALGLTYRGVGVLVQPLGLPLRNDWTQIIPVWERQVNDFTREMEGLVLVDWPIETLHLGRSGARHLFHYQIKLAIQAVLRSIPRVGFINGKYREDVQ